MKLIKSSGYKKLKRPLFVEKNNSLYLDILQLFPKYRNKHPIKFMFIKNKVKVFYDEKSSSLPHPLYLPRYVELDKTFLVGLGIYLAEGARNRRPKITNSEPMIINQAVRFFKLFNFKKSELSGWVQLHERSEKSLNQAKTFWIKNTCLCEKNIRELRIKKSTGDSKVKQYGTLHLEINYILFRLLINNLLVIIPKIVKKLSKQRLIWFLQGAFAGEGSVNITKGGTVNMVRYTSTNFNERSLIKHILEQFEIVVHDYYKKSDLTIMGHKNIKRLVDLNIFEYHTLRKRKLIDGFEKLQNSKVPRLNKEKIVSLLKNKKVLFTSDVCRYFDFSKRGVFKHLDELYKKGEIKKQVGKGTLQNKWFL